MIRYAAIETLIDNDHETLLCVRELRKDPPGEFKVSVDGTAPQRFRQACEQIADLHCWHPKPITVVAYSPAGLVFRGFSQNEAARNAR